MRTSVASLLSAVFLIAGESLAQIPSPRYFGEAAAYEQFLIDVTIIVNNHYFVATNPPTTPHLQRAFQNIEFTDQETEVLKAVAVDYGTKSASLLAATGPLRMEARFQSIDSGQVSEELAKRIRDLDREHDKMVFDQIKRLRDGFGIARFEVLDTFVKANKAK